VSRAAPQLDTKPKTSDGTGNCWPPLAHIFDQSKGAVKEGDTALCGAKLMGIDLPDATKLCKNCIEIAKQRMAS
jgi:hypothetical protein